MTSYEKKQFGFVALGLTFLSFLFFQFFYPYHLFFKEQIQLFIYTPDYFLSYFNKPAWLTSYAGDFLTQFFYLRGGGAAVLSLLFLTEWLLASFVIKRITFTKNTPLWALLPVGIDWILSCDVLHPVSFTIGFIALMVLFLIYSSILNRWLSLIAGAFMSLFGYWLIGSSFLIFPLLILAYDWKKEPFNWAKYLLIVATAFSIPFLFRYNYCLTNLQSYIFPAMKWQSILLPAFLMLALTGAFLLKRFETRYPQMIVSTLSIAFIVLLFFGINANSNLNY